ncbi:DUF4142 domain-containing protein [Rhodopseudomonas sp. HC1]|uniref:DUF4142 domain-containing protein n=1 Tax=Rhodopseudomonas infernalis TaxID=2897386 RepID=UPI001EE81C7C|nr:DUF4142 domain-containing protein [Rhodopseudomonas infernalis]MCG6206398.1 DUF4142 domain-containing protein [Rhodopseudomonas infernalis]
MSNKAAPSKLIQLRATSTSWSTFTQGSSMKTTTALVLSCLLVAAPPMVQTAAAQSSSAQAPAISTATQQFITQVGISDLFEIASSRLALARGTDAQKGYANQMIEDHGKTSSELRQLIVVRGLKIDIPSQLDSAHQGKYDQLNNARGEDFHALYASQQVAAHKDAIALFQRYAQDGDLPELKDWAAKTLPALNHHLEMAQKLTGPTIGARTAK